MRIIVFTGKGGVGKTSVAAATALSVARSGSRTLVLSTDPAHSLADAFEAEAGADPVTAEEITVLPGIEEIFSLTDLKRFHDDGRYECIVVDCAPTAETLRLLSLPEVARWYMERVFPIERRVVRAVR